MLFKISQERFGIFQKMNICLGTFAHDEYMYEISSRYLENRLSFAVLNAQKGHFLRIYEDFGVFPIFIFCPICAVQKVF